MSSHADPLSFFDERRYAPRYAVDFNAPVLVSAVKEDGSGGEQLFPLRAVLHDVSDSGLALTVSRSDMAGLGRFGLDFRMRLLLPLPDGPLELEAEPVRFQRLREGDSAGDFRVGAHITDMSGRDRARYMAFIAELSEGRRTPEGAAV
jgi:hypothetical protein